MSSFAEAGLGRAVGLRVGELLGKTLVLNACLSDREDDLDRRPFRRRIKHLPSGVDLRRWLTPVEDQGEIGSCTSNALASLVEYLISRQTGRAVGVSRLFLYYNQRLWRGSVREDSGSALATGVRVLSRLGVPAEEIWPYERRLFAVQPPRVVYQVASHHRALEYASIPCDADAVRACLAEGFPVAFGTMLFESFKAIGLDGRAPMPSARERQEGAHAMALVGYSDAERLFIVRNSWGAGWGDHGYAYVPYDYILDCGHSHAMWAVRLSESLDFAADEHVEVNLRSMPSAPPPGAASGPVNPFAPAPSGSGLAGVMGSLFGAGGSTRVELAGSLAERFSGAAFTVLTGSAAIGSLLGGVVAGVTPSIVSRVEHGDAGAVTGEDLSPRVLAILRGETPSPAAVAGQHSWDSGQPHGPIAPIAPAHAALPETGNTGGGAPGDVARAAIQARWNAVGQELGPLGAAVSKIQDAPRGGAWLPCRRGGIIAHPSFGAVMLSGPIYELWYRLGAFAGPLGYPAADPFTTGDPNAPEACRFEHGMIAWNAQRGAWVVS